jgi:hypothetical protein
VWNGCGVSPGLIGSPGRRQEEAGLQEPLAERQHARLERDPPEDPRARDERVDPLGSRPLEIVPAGVRPEVEPEHATDLGQVVGRKEVGNDRVALRVDLPGVPGELGGRRSRRHGAVLAAAADRFKGARCRRKPLTAATRGAYRPAESRAAA